MNSAPFTGKSLAIWFPNLSGGGAERLLLNLVPSFLEAGLSVTFLVNRRHGELMTHLPPRAEILSLEASRPLMALPRLIKQLRAHQPDILMSNTEHLNVIAPWARRLSGARTRVVVVQHTVLSEQAKHPTWQFRLLPVLYPLSVPRADAIVAVSQGAADDLATVCGIGAHRVRVIYNGTFTSDFDARASAPVEHRWAHAGVPIILAAGRLVELKDYPVLISAFADVLQHRDARLIILGEGPLHAELADLARRLGVEDRLDMPGFVPNPLPFMRLASVLVLSSRLEGFGNVLAEAMACGTPVVSTNCPYGPAEIVDYGRFGPLTPVGDAPALARAIMDVLAAPLPAATLRTRGEEFSVGACANAYLALFRELLLGPERGLVETGGKG